MKRKEKLKKFARKAFPIIGISAISATFALALNARLKKNDEPNFWYFEIEKRLIQLEINTNYLTGILTKLEQCCPNN